MLTKEKSILEIDNEQYFFDFLKYDIYYKTIIKKQNININKKDLDIYKKYIEKYKKDD